MNREGIVSSFLSSEYLLSTKAVEMILCDLYGQSHTWAVESNHTGVNGPWDENDSFQLWGEQL